MFRKLLTMAGMALCALPPCLAGTLRVGVPQVNGNQVLLPVLLEGDVAGGVAALDFTLNYDPAVFSPVGAEPGAAAQAARKQVESNEASPGNYVVVMMGLNQTTVENGQIASIRLNKLSQPASNQSSVSIQQTAFSSADGFEIASEGSSQTVTFPPPPTDNGGNENPPPPSNTPPVETPGSNPPPTPEPPVNTPSPTTPTTPRVPVGSPQPSQDSPDGAPRATPLLVTPSAIQGPDSANMAPDGITRLNSAAKRLEDTRASLGGPRSTSDSVNSQKAGESGDGENGTAREPSTATWAENHPSEPAKVASVPQTVGQLPAQERAALEKATREAPDSSGIPPRSRRMLIIVGAAVAISALVFRFARHSTR